MHGETPIGYEAPGARQEQQQRRSAFHRSVLGQLATAFVVVLLSVMLCAAGGGVLGSVIAHRFPSYYPSVYRTAATQPGFNATEVGVATGIGQGAAAGLLVGAVIVLALAVANWRRSAPQG